MEVIAALIIVFSLGVAEIHMIKKNCSCEKTERIEKQKAKTEMAKQTDAE